MTTPNRMLALGARLQVILAAGLAEDPLAHAEQVAEIAGVLHDAFEPEGFSATLVGGSAIEIHAPGAYVSGDLDYVIDRVSEGKRKVNEIFEALGFKKQGGRHWVFGDLFIEQVSGPVAGPTEEVRVGESVFRVVTKNDMKKSLPDLREKWTERLERVRRSQARTDIRGMTRPPRDPIERAFLRRIGREGPFIEGAPPQKPKGRSY